MTEPAVRFEQITKRFLGVQALDGVTLEVAAGSCHALCGENGAGKSTLGKVLAGIHSPDAGKLFVRGREVRFDSPRDAFAAGVGMVHQELAYCGNMTVAENLLLGNLPRRRGFVDRGSLERRAHEMLAEIGAPPELDVRAPMSELRIAQQQLGMARAVGTAHREAHVGEQSPLASVEDRPLGPPVGLGTTDAAGGELQAVGLGEDGGGQLAWLHPITVDAEPQPSPGRYRPTPVHPNRQGDSR